MIGASVLIVKIYQVNLDDLSVLNVNLPAQLFDVVALALLLFGAVSFAFNWIGDVTAYTKWYTDREIWSQFNTRMPLDRTFYSGGVHLIKRLYEVENDLDSTERLADLPEDVRERYEEFKGNIELFTLRLSEH